MTGPRSISIWKRRLPLVALIGSIFCAAPAVRAQELKSDLDCAANPQLLDNHFGQYGYKAGIKRDGDAIRFRLPAAEKPVEQTGLYSLFALAGEFEFSATYDWLEVPPPDKGYGVSCGIAVETLKQTPGGGYVSVARAQVPKKGPCYTVTRGTPTESGMKYEPGPDSPYTARSSIKRGQLIIRREQANLVCLAAYEGQEPDVLCTVPFTEGSIRKVLLFVDPGESTTPVDVALSQIRIKAEKHATEPKRLDPQGMSWWIIVLIVAAVAALGGLVYHRYTVIKRRAEESD
jgi:hypothetical protein